MSTEKRFVMFLVLAVLIMAGSMYLQAIFFPPPPPDEVAEVDGEEAEPGAEGEEDPDDEDLDGDEPPTEGGDAEPPDAPDEEEPDEAPDAPTIEAHPDLEPRWLTLGSLDPESDYRMVVTFASRGAAVERIELNQNQFRDLTDKAGYLGFLAPSDELGGRGCRIGVAPPGTPAALATSSDSGDKPGLRGPEFDEAGAIVRPGDLIVAFGDETIADAAELQRALSRTRPGDEVTIDVLREDDFGNVVERTFTVKLAQPPSQVVRPESELRSDLAVDHPLSFLTTLYAVGNSKLGDDEQELPGLRSLYDGVWQSEYVEYEGELAVEFRMTLSDDDLQAIGQSGALDLVKRYRLAQLDNGDESAPAYHLVMDIEIENLGAEPQNVAYRLQGPTGMPLEGWWYAYKVHPTRWTGAGTRDIIWRSVDGEHRMIVCSQVVKYALKAEENDESPFLPLRDDDDGERMQYAGVDAQYFAVALLADDDSDNGAEPRFAHAAARLIGEEDELRRSRSDVTFMLDSEQRVLQPGETWSQQFTIFAGPKQPDLLAKYDLEETVVYGWSIIAVVAKPMQWFLHWIYGFVGNYGIAIILLTVVVRGCLSPLGRKVAMNAKRMQELQPEMTRIKEQHKNDPQKQMEAQRELFRKHNYNPLGGCWLMFLQLPIFIGLYRALSVDIELRGAPLIPGVGWASNLAAPDMLFRWDGIWQHIPLIGGVGSEGGMLGPYFNLLPMITVVLFLVQQKMFTPPPQNEEQAMQHKVMSFMTVFIGFLFFRVPARPVHLLHYLELVGYYGAQTAPHGKERRQGEVVDRR